MDLKIVKLENGIKQVTMVGRLDMVGAESIADKFTFQITTEKAPVLVDLSDVEFIASIGMRLLISSAKALDRRGGKMVLYNPQPLVAEALETAGIDTLIPMYADMERANRELLA